jgi:hypothetical protein
MIAGTNMVGMLNLIVRMKKPLQSWGNAAASSFC